MKSIESIDLPRLAKYLNSSLSSCGIICVLGGYRAKYNDTLNFETGIMLLFFAADLFFQ